MGTWLHLVQPDGSKLYSWHILNRFGESIAESVRRFMSEEDAKRDLDAYLRLMGRGPA